MRALERWRRHRKTVQKTLVRAGWRARVETWPGAGETPPERPLEVIAAVEELVTAPREVDPGPCGSSPVLHRWPPDWILERVGAYLYRHRSCQRCGYHEGSLWPA